jgi:hypothetical protein
MSTCKHGNSAPGGVIARLHESQEGIRHGKYIWRHKCCHCAYARGLNLGSAGSSVPKGEAFCKAKRKSAPLDEMEDLPRAQGGEGRHRCAICALHAGFMHGRASAVGKSLSEPPLQQSVEISAAIIQERSAGFQTNSNLCRFVEDHAMKKARKVLQEWGGLSITDTSRHACFDYTCLRNGAKYFVEVKGTQTEGSAVILTKNEVAHAKKHPKHSIFILVHSIQVKAKKTNDFVLSGGEIVFKKPWAIDHNDLTAIQYFWTVK